MNILIPLVISQSVGFFLLLYISWRRLKEDYISSQIFNFMFSVVFSVVLTGLFSNFFFPKYMLWCVAMAIPVTAVVAVKKFGMKFLETFDVLVFSLAVYFALASTIYLFLRDTNGMLFFGSSIFLVIIFLLVENNYKNFSWYKSGRKGFASFFTIGLFFLIRSIIALVNPNMVFLLLDYDPILSGLLSFVSFLGIFYLGRQ